MKMQAFISFMLISLFISAQYVKGSTIFVEDSTAIDIKNNDMPKVCGIPFGSSYGFVEQELTKRFGEKSVYSDRNEIKYFDFHMGNYVFDSAKFCFEYDNDGASYFNYATFHANYSLEEYDKAKDMRNSLYQTLVRKYGLVSMLEDKNGEPMYFCGMHPFIAERSLIILYLVKEQSVGGEWFYYVILSYGPINFTNEIGDF